MADQPSATKLGDGKATQETQPAETESATVKFSGEEEAELLSESNTHKDEANTLFNKGSYDQALTKYSDANAVLPNYLDYELAVLQSNISACHIKLKEWKAATTAATTALDRLDKLDAELALELQALAAAHKKHHDALSGGPVVDDEIISAGATATAAAAAMPATPDDDDDDDPDAPARAQRQTDSQRIRYKALMRRARARSEEGGWTNLEGARADYAALQKMDNLAGADRRLVAAQLRVLPGRVAEAKERETAQMWDQLKQLGNGILKPFGLSTDSFQMQQDPKTGGYSMNMKSG